MLYTQHFIIETHWLGQAERPAVYIHAEAQPPRSLIFLCECCGTEYARCPVVGSNLWQPIMRCCRHCTPNSLTAPAGSIWLSWDNEFTLAFPPAVLDREFLLHLNHYSKDQI